MLLPSNYENLVGLGHNKLFIKINQKLLMVIRKSVKIVNVAAVATNKTFKTSTTIS